MYPICKASGGQHYNIAADGDVLSFCPLQYLESKTDIAWAAEWIDTILALNNLTTTPGQRNEIALALTNMQATNSKTLTDFTSSIQDTSVRDALKQYTVDGMTGHLLDASEDGLSLVTSWYLRLKN